LAEFTGERVIPGQVDVDLLNEHMARYTFASRLARNKRVLDAGCGAGYGSAELARHAASVAGVDVASEAVDFARENYRLPNLRFAQGSCASLPFPDGSFDLVVGFEVIEHIPEWREFLLEARRVLSPSGQFIVSTPNRLYYTESRGPDGANPFHVHEFDFAEFTAELKSVFPHISLFLENHVEGVTFQPHEPSHTAEVRIDAGDPAPDESHFFLAVCAHRPQIGNPTFVYVPRAANVLRERERHIAKLEGELAQKDEWLDKAQADLAQFDREHQKLLGMFRDQTAELEKSNAWAAALNLELEEARAGIGQLEEALAEEQRHARATADAYDAKVRELEADIRAKAQWALDTEAALTAELKTARAETAKCLDALHGTETELEERTAWALRLEQDARRLGEQVSMYRASRWIKLGRRIGLGPAFPTS
jgi:SAM-dependent methyltransferase